MCWINLKLTPCSPRWIPGRWGDLATGCLWRNTRAETRRRSDVQTYDFKRPERVSKDQMRALEALHEGFGRNLGAALSGYLRTIIEVSVAHIEQLTYSEFIHSLPNPTCFNLLKAEQLDGQLCLEISPLIIYPIIDRLLGGSSSDLFIRSGRSRRSNSGWCNASPTGRPSICLKPGAT